MIIVTRRIVILVSALIVAIVRVGTTQAATVPVTSATELKKKSLAELMDIEVTSVLKRSEKLSESPSAIQVVTNNDIRRSGATNFPEALRLAPNLQVAQGTSASWNIGARGFNAAVGNKILALVDGRSIYTPLFSGVIWNVQDYLLEDIERIEVISGPGGTQWGANAVNGVINIISKDAKDTQGTYFEVGGGSELEEFTAIRYGGRLAPEAFFRVYAKWFDRDSAALSDGTSAGDPWNRGQLGFRLDAEPSTQDRLTMQGDYYIGDTDVQTGNDGQTFGGNILARWTHQYATNAETTLQFYYDRTHLEAPFPESGTIPGGTLKDDLDTVDIDLQHRFSWGDRHQIVMGLSHRFTHDVVMNIPTVAFFPKKLNHELYSGFIQNEIKLRDRLLLILGTKLEHNEYTNLEVEPSGRLAWTVSDNQMLWAAVSRAIRTPARYDRDLFQPDPLFGIFLGGNSDFRSETVVAYELGYRASLGTKISGSLSIFFNDYDHLRSLGFTPITFVPLVFQNNLWAHTYGSELSVSYQATERWRLRFGHSYIKEDIHLKAGAVDLFNRLNETADPRHQASIHSSLDLMRNLELDGALRWVDTLRNNMGPIVGKVPSYFEIDVRLAFLAAKNVELALVGQNLLHNHHPEFGFPSPAREEIERSIYGRVSWSF